MPPTCILKFTEVLNTRRSSKFSGARMCRCFHGGMDAGAHCWLAIQNTDNYYTLILSKHARESGANSRHFGLVSWLDLCSETTSCHHGFACKVLEMWLSLLTPRREHEHTRTHADSSIGGRNTV
jgi:hypothetical protein